MHDDSEIEMDHALRLDALADAFQAARRANPALTAEAFAAEHDDVSRESLLAVLRGADLLARSRAQDVGPFTAGERVGPYVVGDAIGRGGMGIVYGATETGLGRRVALKALNAITVDERTRTRFAREARAAALLDHSAIVPVYGSGETHGVLWYAMRRVDGQSLDRVLAALRPDQPDAVRARALELLAGSASSASRSGSATSASRMPLRERAAVSIARTLASALAYAHERGILHRDVKPANVLLDEHGQPHLTDFGLCKVEGDQSLTAEGDIVGTLRYMAPEALEGQFDHRGDVYGLGLVLYELCAGRPAFAADSRQSMLHQVLHTDPPPLRRFAPDLSIDLERIVRKATAKLPDERYGSASAFAEDLDALLSGKPVRARRPSPFYLLGLFVRRNRALSATLAVATLFLVAGTLLYVVNLRDAFDETQTALLRAEASGAEARIAGAEATLRTGDVGGARELLEEVPLEHRGWMWEHLAARVGHGVQSLTTWVKDIEGMVADPSGVYVLVDGWDGMEVFEREGMRSVRRIDVGVVDARFVDGGASVLYLEQNPRRLAVVSLEDPTAEPRTIADFPTSVTELRPVAGTGFAVLLDGYNTLVGYDWRAGEEVWRQEIGVPRISAYAPLTEADIVFATTGGQVLRANASGGAADLLAFHTGRVTALLDDGDTLLASGASDGSLELQPALTGHTQVRVQLEAGVSCIARHPELSHLIAVGLESRGVALVDARLGVVLRTLSGMGTTPQAAHFGKDPWLVALSIGATLTFHGESDHDGRIELTPSLGNAFDVSASADGRWVLNEASDGLLWLHDLVEGTTRVIPRAGAPVRAKAVFAPDGSLVVSGGTAIDLATGEVRWRVPGERVSYPCALPSGDLAFVRVGDGGLQRFRVRAGSSEPAALGEPLEAVDGRVVRAIGDRGAEALWLANDEGVVARLAGDELGVEWLVRTEVEACDLAVDHERRELYLVSIDGMVRVFDAGSGEERVERAWRASPAFARKSTLSAIVAGPAPGLVTTCTMDGRVEVWDSATARRAGALLTSGSDVRHLDVLGGTGWIVGTGGFGRTILLGSGAAPVGRFEPAGPVLDLAGVLDLAEREPSLARGIRFAATRSNRFRPTPWMNARLKR